jgi:Ni,Fe-hydrogenase III small subunit/formate hydrogenlyase subunit 6/NADH:ubiquinone oxidoreductase subunit I
MINIIKKFIQHGIVTVNYPNKPITSSFITGEPVIDLKKCNQCNRCIHSCPLDAISMHPRDESLQINIDECIFCHTCVDICPQQAITMTTRFELAKHHREPNYKEKRIINDHMLSDQEYEVIGAQLKENIKKYFGRSLHIREVDAGSCNGCDNEINALNGPYNDLERFGISFVASPRHADLLLVTGPVTRNMELALVKTYNATPDPKLVIAVGTCAISGGIFKDSYAVRNGVDSLLPVDIYIPGCPPRPQAIIYALLKAIERI